VELREAQIRSGAVFPPGNADSGLPLHFGSPSAEYAAAASTAALFDFSDRTLVELTGADRVRFLHSFCTNDVKRLAAGQGCEAFVPNVKGRVIGHVWIAVVDSALWLDADPGSAEQLVPHLERYVINEDVAIADRSAEWGKLLLTGPETADLLARLGIHVATLANLEHSGCELLGTPARIGRFDVGPHRGYTVVMRRDRLADCWNCLRERGAHPSGSAVWNALRIEAGLPISGVDITGDNLVQEVGRTQTAVSFTKGCYLGQEPIARIDAMGHVNRELRSLRLAGDTVPPIGARAFSDATASHPVGTITSAAFSFASNGPVAMALLRSNASACDTQVFVERNENPVAATIFWFPNQTN
jgi:folate-binding protein YgfZ